MRLLLAFIAVLIYMAALIQWRYAPNEAEARPYCYRPVNMQTTMNCTRIPTPALPYCPNPSP